MKCPETIKVLDKMELLLVESSECLVDDKQESIFKNLHSGFLRLEVDLVGKFPEFLAGGISLKDSLLKISSICPQEQSREDFIKSEISKLREKVSN